MTLRADHIDLTLQARRVLRDVSAEFLPGKVSVILGPNGAGKSSLLACLSGGRLPNLGTVWIGDQSLPTLAPKDRARRIGLLPQSGDVHWDIEAGALVGLGRFAHQGRGGQSPADSAAVDAAMAATDTMQFANRNVLQLSGGERARVLLARVLAGEPQWLLADEPLANLDPRHQIDILNVLRAQADMGIGVIVVLHDLNQAARIADHIILMHGGQIATSGTAAVVLTPDNLARVYGIECIVSDDAATTLSINILGRC